MTFVQGEEMKRQKRIYKKSRLLICLLLIMAMTNMNTVFAVSSGYAVANQGTVDKTPEDSGRDKVYFSKTIAQVQDNVFDITLQIKSVERIRAAQKQDISVLLLLDETSAQETLQEAVRFVLACANDSRLGNVYIGVVGYGHSATMYTDFLNCKEDGAEIIQAMGEISHYDGYSRNLEQGLYLSGQMLQDFQKPVSSSSVIVFSAGMPNYGVERNWPADVISASGTQGAVDDVMEFAEILQSKAQVYTLSLCMDASERSLMRQIATDNTTMFSAAPTEIEEVTARIYKEITTDATELWQVKDVLNDGFAFDVQWNRANGISAVDEMHSRYFDGKNLIWNINENGSDEVAVEVLRDGRTAYVYQLKYRVSLSESLPGTYATNDKTELNYCLTRSATAKGTLAIEGADLPMVGIAGISVGNAPSAADTPGNVPMVSSNESMAGEQADGRAPANGANSQSNERVSSPMTNSGVEQTQNTRPNEVRVEEASGVQASESVAALPLQAKEFTMKPAPSSPNHVIVSDIEGERYVEMGPGGITQGIWNASADGWVFSQAEMFVPNIPVLQDAATYLETCVVASMGSLIGMCFLTQTPKRRRKRIKQA